MVGALRCLASGCFVCERGGVVRGGKRERVCVLVCKRGVCVCVCVCVCVHLHEAETEYDEAESIYKYRDED